MSIANAIDRRKRRIKRRLHRSAGNPGPTDVWGVEHPYELGEKTRGIGTGGIGTVHQLAKTIGLIDAIDRHVHVLKIHLPYHESDAPVRRNPEPHVLAEKQNHDRTDNAKDDPGFPRSRPKILRLDTT